MPDFEYISEPLRQFAVPVTALRKDPRNARLHPDRNIHGIRQSLRKFGQQKPIVADVSGMIIAGNGTLEAAELEGWTHVAVITTELTGPDATAFGLADNRTAETAEWDFERVSELVKELKAYEYDLGSLGWNQDEYGALLSGDLSSFSQPTDPQGYSGPRVERTYVPFEDDQAAVVNEAVAKMRKSEGDNTIPDGRALELILADWYSGS